MNYTRRSVLATGSGALASATLAGCLSDPPEDDSNADEGYAAFFALWDWAEQIAGDELDFENPVDVGEMGHGWEPPSQLPADVAQSGTFIYLDTPEFSWAQELASELERDHDDVALIDAMEGLEPHLLAMDEEDGDEDREPTASEEFDPTQVSVAEFDVYDARTGERVMYWHDGHWHGGVPDVELDGSVTVEPVFEDDEGRILPLGDEEAFHVDAVVADGAQDGIVDIVSGGDSVRFDGISTGRTRMYYRLLADDDVLWDTSNDLASVQVVEELEETEAPEFYDPHVWVDPVLAQQMVETIAEELAEIDPDNEETFRENAEDYVERLAAVDQQFEELAAEAIRDVVIFAGHDSFGYLDARYGFEIHTPVGISADEVDTLGDISEMATLVDDHDIDTVLYDPFETPDPDEDVPDMVQVLLESTDVEQYEPLTPVEGTTPDWKDAGYGWIEQMEEINLPSLRKALGVE